MIDIKQQLTTQNVIIGLLTLAVVYLMYVNYTRSCNEKYNNIGSKFSIPTGYIGGSADPSGLSYIVADSKGNLSSSDNLKTDVNFGVDTFGLSGIKGVLVEDSNWVGTQDNSKSYIVSDKSTSYNKMMIVGHNGGVTGARRKIGMWDDVEISQDLSLNGNITSDVKIGTTAIPKNLTVSGNATITGNLTAPQLTFTDLNVSGKILGASNVIKSESRILSTGQSYTFSNNLIKLGVSATRTPIFYNPSTTSMIVSWSRISAVWNNGSGSGSILADRDKTVIAGGSISLQSYGYVFASETEIFMIVDHTNNKLYRATFTRVGRSYDQNISGSDQFFVMVEYLR